VVELRPRKRCDQFRKPFVLAASGSVLKLQTIAQIVRPHPLYRAVHLSPEFFFISRCMERVASVNRFPCASLGHPILNPHQNETLILAANPRTVFVGFARIASSPRRERSTSRVIVHQDPELRTLVPHHDLALFRAEIVSSDQTVEIGLRDVHDGERSAADSARQANFIEPTHFGIIAEA